MQCRRKRKLWSTAGRVELEQLELLPYAAQRRRGEFEATILGARTEEMGGETLRPPRD